MFLSKVSFAHSSRAKHEYFKLFQNGVYSSHQLVWRLFSNESQRKFLYREDITENGLPVFYILSQVKPVDLDFIFNIETKPFSPKLYSGQTLGFRLRCNPTVTRLNEHGKKQHHDVMMHAKTEAKREGVIDPNQIKSIAEQAVKQWFITENRLERWGIHTDILPDICQYQRHCTTKPNKHRIWFSSVDLQGLLTVRNPETFLAGLVNGFGRSKSMGCGLMLIRAV